MGSDRYAVILRACTNTFKKIMATTKSLPHYFWSPPHASCSLQFSLHFACSEPVGNPRYIVHRYLETDPEVPGSTRRLLNSGTTIQNEAHTRVLPFGTHPLVLFATLSENKLAFPQRLRTFRRIRLTKDMVLRYDWLKTTKPYLFEDTAFATKRWSSTNWNQSCRTERSFVLLIGQKCSLH